MFSTGLAIRHAYVSKERIECGTVVCLWVSPEGYSERGGRGRTITHARVHHNVKLRAVNRITDTAQVLVLYHDLMCFETIFVLHTSC